MASQLTGSSGLLRTLWSSLAPATGAVDSSSPASAEPTGKDPASALVAAPVAVRWQPAVLLPSKLELPQGARISRGLRYLVLCWLGVAVDRAGVSGGLA